MKTSEYSEIMEPVKTKPIKEVKKEKQGKQEIKTNLHVAKDIFELRKTNFALWCPGKTQIQPTVYIAKINYDYAGNKFEFEKVSEKPLLQSTNFSDLWLLDIRELKNGEVNLKDGGVYHYWFKIRNTNPYEKNQHILYCTDPFATVVDERIQAQDLPENEMFQKHYSPAGVFKLKNNEMIPADPNGDEIKWMNLFSDNAMSKLPENKQLVIYELPVKWSYVREGDDTNEPAKRIADGSFRQIEKMIDFPDNNTYLDNLFKGILDMKGKKYLDFLGINALELCPPANSSQREDWGYGTSGYFAADYTLSDREKESVNGPRPATAFIDLVKACHKKRIRYFYDAVMAFATDHPYRHIDFSSFFIEWNSGEPEQDNRDGYGGDLLRYNYFVTGYNPNSSSDQLQKISPAREFMIAHLKEWIKNKGITGIRIDSVPNINNYDFLEMIKNTFDVPPGSTKMHIVGEDLGNNPALLGQDRLNGAWNEIFKKIMRKVILGKNWDNNNFEWSVRKMIDCTQLNCNFTTGTQAVNYFTSHDVGGFENERLYNYLHNNGVIFKKDRVILAFACLMTAVGIPMFLAGEEFSDVQDLFSENEKQRDPLNLDRLKDDPWRKDIFYKVARLIKLRTQSDALASDHVEFIHCDFNEGKRVMAWMRFSGEDIVITVANFSDWGSYPGTDYQINNWPRVTNKKWIEVTMDRIVDAQFVGREPIFPWEAKVYRCINL